MAKMKAAQDVSNHVNMVQMGKQLAHEFDQEMPI
jgi:hypothetical protein